jgi:soluble lytic murein transglycosylase
MNLWIKILRQYFLFSCFLAILFCSGCTKENQKSINSVNGNQQLSTLPPELQKEHVKLTELLSDYDNLDGEQRAIALEHILTQANLPGIEQSQAAYMLGRIYQESIGKNKDKQVDQVVKKQKCQEALALFIQAETDPALKNRSLWHISEVATIYGGEKIVRQALNDLLNGATDTNLIVSARYGLAQSYLRANEVDNAVDAFKKIRIEFPDTNYALGSSYYLGTLAYAQFDQEHKSQNNQQQNSASAPDYRAQLKIVLPYYLDYLQKSPSGRFATDILIKLEVINKFDSSLVKIEKLAIIANAYFAHGQYETALSYWLKAGTEKYVFEIANCFIRLGQIKLAQTKLFQAVERYPADKRYLALSEDLCTKLNKQDALELWQKLYKSKVCNKDEVIWNLAIRMSQSPALHYYQQIVTGYPTSAYAPEAQWRIFWQRIKQNKGKSVIVIGNWCAAAAKKYSHSRLAPRFLFWAGKLNEIASNKQQAAIYYQQNQELFPTDYYGQRANARYAYLKNGSRDNYFELQSPTRLDNRQWDWPLPKIAVESLQMKEKDTIKELIYLKQYDEILAQNLDLSVELIVWLKGKTRQAMAAINTAAKWLQEKDANRISSELSYDKLLWQYSYPLLYNREIISYCRGAGISDPFFLHALIREESRYEAHAISSAKALGLCQLMPNTAVNIAKRLGINIIDTSQLFDPDLNIKLGSLYLSSVLKTFNSNGLLAIASYNAGSNAVKNQIQNKPSSVMDPDYFLEDFPYRETRDYIRKVFSSYYRYREIYH